MANNSSILLKKKDANQYKKWRKIDLNFKNKKSNTKWLPNKT